MTVLLAHVHRDGSEAVFDAAVRQAAYRSVPLVVLNVAPGEAPVDDRIAPTGELDDLVRRAGDQGVTATIEQPVGGDVASLIVEHADKHGAELVVIGVRRRSPSASCSWAASRRRCCSSPTCRSSP
ncbi:universal stress protein [Nocardioides marmoraquaticus]